MAESPTPESHPDAARASAESLDASVRAVGAAGRATAKSAADTARALRRLLVADFALARISLARALVWTAVAVIFGASAWLLLMGALVALLQHTLGWSWLASISLCALVSLAVTAYAAWRVVFYFRHTSLQATRRQLRALGLGDDDDAEHPTEAEQR